MIYGATQERAERKLRMLRETLEWECIRYEKEMSIIQESKSFLVTDEYCIDAKKHLSEARGYRYHIAYVDEMLDVDDEDYNIYIRRNILPSAINSDAQIYRFRFSDDKN